MEGAMPRTVSSAKTHSETSATRRRTRLRPGLKVGKAGMGGSEGEMETAFLKQRRQERRSWWKKAVKYTQPAAESTESAARAMPKTAEIPWGIGTMSPRGDRPAIRQTPSAREASEKQATRIPQPAMQKEKRAHRHGCQAHPGDGGAAASPLSLTRRLPVELGGKSQGIAQLLRDFLLSHRPI